MSPKEDSMVSRVIQNLLKTEKRVTVPALGSFMRRGDGIVVFTDMFKDNDGVLTRAIAEAQSVTELQAAESISKWVSEVEKNLTDKDCAELSFGRLQRNDDGRVVFVMNSTPVSQPTQPTSAPVVEQPQQTAPQPEVTHPVTPVEEKPQTPIMPRPVPPRVAQPTPRQRVERPAEVRKPQRDWVLIAAIAAAVIALAVMAYGVINSDVTSTIILE